VRAIVTRPAQEAAQWVSALAGHGIEAVALPLIDIAHGPQPQAVAAAWSRLGQCAAVMFVSPNAVAHFLAQRPPGAPWPGVRAWAPGPGTRDALVSRGVPASLVDAPAPGAPQFDSEALWQQVGPGVQPGDRVLLVRGAGASGQGEGRDWLAQQLEAAGATVETIAAYARRLPVWQPADLALARQAAHDGSLWLFSSSQAVAHLQQLLTGQSWSAAQALATHPRIVDAARAAGFGVVRGSRPALADVVASIESIR
jgi:uroporphyrinogen-III synthase